MFLIFSNSLHVQQHIKNGVPITTCQRTHVSNDRRMALCDDDVNYDIRVLR